MHFKTGSVFKFNRVIFLLVVLFLFLGHAVQGAPAQKGRYMRVKCTQNSKTANCIEEKGPWIDIPDHVPNVIHPPVPKSNLLKTLQDLHNIFPLSEGSGEEPGSGTDLESKTETEEHGSALEDNFDYSNFVFPEPIPRKQNREDGLNLVEDNLIL